MRIARSCASPTFSKARSSATVIRRRFGFSDPQSLHSDDRRGVEILRRRVAQHPLQEIDFPVDRARAGLRRGPRLHVGTDPIGIDRRQQIIPEERDEVLQELGLAPAAATQAITSVP
jgi:hypothetical protein